MADWTIDMLEKQLSSNKDDILRSLSEQKSPPIKVPPNKLSKMLKQPQPLLSI